MNPVFTLPKSFDPAEFLPRYLRQRHDDARYLVSLIVSKMLRSRLDERGCARLTNENLRKIMHGHDYIDVIRELIENGAIERFPYIIHIQAHGYRLSARFVADALVEVPITDKRLLGRLIDQNELHEDAQQERLKPVHKSLREMQTHLTIEDAAYETLNAIPPAKKRTEAEHELWKTTQRWQIDKIKNKQWSFQVASTGRVFNNISNLKRTLRQHLRLDGNSIKGVDLSCFQPALLAHLMQRSTQPTTRNEATHPTATLYVGQEVFSSGKPDFFSQLVQDGRLNDYLKEQVDRNDIRVQCAKKRFLVDVLAKRGNYPSKFEDMFREQFPEVFHFIRKFNQSNPAALIRRLQKMEAEFVIGVVSPRLLQRHPEFLFLTLHDAIFSAATPMVEQAFSDACEEVGFKFNWKVDQ